MLVTTMPARGPAWPMRHVVVPDADSARSLLASLPAHDFLKIYDGLSRPAYAAILDVALPVFPVPAQLGLT